MTQNPDIGEVIASIIRPDSNDGDRRDQTDIDPIVRGLFARLPKSGNVWPKPDRELWFNLLENSFKLIYKDAPPCSGDKE
jgi:hypothetical protein